MARKSKKIEYKNFGDLVRKLSVLNDKLLATRKLTQFFAHARFKIDDDAFDRQYTDGSDDGGIDFYHEEDTAFFIFQSKFVERSNRIGPSDIIDELAKIQKSITIHNTNRKAADFISDLNRQLKNKDAILEIIWVTTNIIEPSVVDKIEKYITEWRKKKGFLLDIDFVAIDRYALERVIYDAEHGFVPYTGKKTLGLYEEKWLEESDSDSGVNYIAFSANVNDILRWFKDADDIDNFLQKNVRGFIGDNTINRGIAKSYLETPEWFWYKHNGIIIFADNMIIDKSKMRVMLRNPQIVNGGQTLKALFRIYNGNHRAENASRVLLRIYRMPYDRAETYQRSIDIIAALNSQNKILASDLRSTDPVQVKIELLLASLNYKYVRKRAERMRSTLYNIKMRDLALRYYVCKKEAPHFGVAQEVEKLFEEESKYKEIFPESFVNKDLDSNHITIMYITIWVIDQLLKKIKLSKRDEEYFVHTKWYVLADIYKKLMDWKKKRFSQGWQRWNDFLDSKHFARAISSFGARVFPVGRKIIPRDREARLFFSRGSCFRS